MKFPDAEMQRLKSRSLSLLLAEQFLMRNFKLCDKWKEYGETSCTAPAAYPIDPTKRLSGKNCPDSHQEYSIG